MVEWGSGASTIKWLQEMRSDQKLVSIEHNKEWYSKVRPIIDSSDDLANKLDYHFCEPSGYWRHGYGVPAEENPMGLDRYLFPMTKYSTRNCFD